MKKIIVSLILLASLVNADTPSEAVKSKSECRNYKTLSDELMKIASEEWAAKNYSPASAAASMSSMYNNMYIRDCSPELITLSDGTVCIKNSSKRCFQISNINY